MNSAFSLPAGDPRWCGRAESFFNHSCKFVRERLASNCFSRAFCSASDEPLYPVSEGVGGAWPKANSNDSDPERKKRRIPVMIPFHANSPPRPDCEFG